MNNFAKTPTLEKLFSTKRHRFMIVIAVYFLALTISWWNLNKIYPDEPISFLESVGVSLFLGFMALPLSAGHLLSQLGSNNVINVAGRPLLFLIELGVSLLVFFAFIIFVTKGNKLVGLFASIYMILAAPYWGYYSFGLVGI